MSTAAERAEARRKAILAKRGDRLAKLTTSARGEDASAYLHDDAPSFSKNFLGEEPGSDMPTPSRLSVSPSPSSTPSKMAASSSSAAPAAASPSPPSTLKSENLFSNVDDSVWSPELQEQFRQALMNAASPQPATSRRVPSGASSSGPAVGAGNEPSANDPLADPFAPFLNGQQGKILEAYGKFMGGQPSPTTSTVDRTKAITSLIQTVLSCLLLAYFVFWAEPAAYVQRVGSLDVGRWSRWAVLGENKDTLELLSTFKVQPVAFFWAFVALEVAFRFFTIQNTLASGNAYLPLLGAVPGLSSLASVISIALLFLNDLAGIVFGLGVIVYLAGLAK